MTLEGIKVVVDCANGAAYKQRRGFCVNSALRL